MAHQRSPSGLADDCLAAWRGKAKTEQQAYCDQWLAPDRVANAREDMSRQWCSFPSTSIGMTAQHEFISKFDQACGTIGTTRKEPINMTRRALEPLVDPRDDRDGRPIRAGSAEQRRRASSRTSSERSLLTPRSTGSSGWRSASSSSASSADEEEDAPRPDAPTRHFIGECEGLTKEDCEAPCEYKNNRCRWALQEFYIGAGDERVTAPPRTTRSARTAWARSGAPLAAGALAAAAARAYLQRQAPRSSHLVGRAPFGMPPGLPSAFAQPPDFEKGRRARLLEEIAEHQHLLGQMEKNPPVNMTAMTSPQSGWITFAHQTVPTRDGVRWAERIRARNDELRRNEWSDKMLNEKQFLDRLIRSATTQGIVRPNPRRMPVRNISDVFAS